MQNNNSKKQNNNSVLSETNKKQNSSLNDPDKISLVVDASQYQNVKVSSNISWFHSILAVCLTVIGIFFGVILCCLIILYVR